MSALTAHLLERFFGAGVGEGPDAAVLLHSSALIDRRDSGIDVDHTAFGDLPPATDLAGDGEVGGNASIARRRATGSDTDFACRPDRNVIAGNAEVATTSARIAATADPSTPETSSAVAVFSGARALSRRAAPASARPSDARTQGGFRSSAAGTDRGRSSAQCAGRRRGRAPGMEAGSEGGLALERPVPGSKSRREVLSAVRQAGSI